MGFWYVAWFYYLLRKTESFNKGSALKSLVKKALYTTIAATILDVLLFEILNVIITDADAWNMFLHWEITAHNFLILYNFTHFWERLIQIPIWNYRKISKESVYESSSSQNSSRVKSGAQSDQNSNVTSDGPFKTSNQVNSKNATD